MTPEEQALMLRREMDRQGVTNVQLRAGIGAITMGESGLKMEAETGYAHTNNDRIRTIFGARVSSLGDDALDRLKADPEAFFNLVYGGPWGARNLGNTQPGDGFKFRGRGLLQLTGRSNYARYGRMIGVDLETNPDSANKPEVACAVAIAYMRDRYKGGGWPGMKAAVGNNIPDIDTRKNQLFNQYLASGEFGPVTTPDQGEGGDTGENTTTKQPSVRSAVERVKAIQQVLAEDGLYQGAIDGDFGAGSAGALGQLVKQAGRER